MKKTHLENKSTNCQNNDDQITKLDCSNYCVSGMMSRCSAGKVWQEHQRCKFSRRSSVSDRCMHYVVPLDGHCDCAEAQKEMGKSPLLEDDDL